MTHNKISQLHDQQLTLLSGPLRGIRDDDEDPTIEPQALDLSLHLTSKGVRTWKTHHELANSTDASTEDHPRQVQPRKRVRVLPASAAALDAMRASSAAQSQHIATLRASLPLNEPAFRIQSVLADILPVQRARKVLEWNVSWDADEDLNLIIGVLRHGFGNWGAIGADSELKLTGKLFPGSKELVPNDVVLERRVEYLFSLLKPASTLPPSPKNYPQKPKNLPEAPSAGSGGTGFMRRSQIPCALPSPPQSEPPLPSPDIEIILVRPSSVVPSKRKAIASPTRPDRNPLTPHKDASIRPRSLVYKTQLQAEGSTTLRDIISHRWTRAARQARAASIVFVNDVDDEDLPPGIENFRYLESSIDESHVRLPALDEDDKPHCRPFDHGGDNMAQHSCVTDHGSQCNCIVRSSRGFMESAYDKDGFFRLDDVPNNGEFIIECNEFCCCTLQCSNRRSQWPRDTSLQIFKSRNPASRSSRTDGRHGPDGDYGWGVRATMSIRRGQVLGFFTGELRERPLDDECLDYGFDIDDHGFDINDPGGKYTVDATTSGNWTRFLNHSCEPNLMVYTAAVEFPPAYQLGRIVFVALEDIPPLTELTFDYCPGKLPPFAPRCLCGSKICRDGSYRQKKKSAEDDPDGAYDPSDEYSDTDNDNDNER